MKRLKVALGGLIAFLALPFLIEGLFWLSFRLLRGLSPSTTYAMFTGLGALVLVWAALTWLLVRHQGTKRRREFVLAASAVLFALPFLLILGLGRPLRLLYRLASSPAQTWWLEWHVLLGQWLLSDMTRYIAVSLAALILSAAALIWLVVRERGQALGFARLYGLILALAAVLIFPFVMRYRPAVEATPGVELRIVDKPGLLEGAVKRCQAAAEVRDCVYEPTGWADAETLVYRKWCGGYHTEEGWQPGVPGTVMLYDVEAGQTGLSLIDQAPSHATCNPGVCVTPLLAEKEYFAPLHYLPGYFEDPVVSPDGRWIAFTARHVYGPEDLFVMSND